MPVGLTEGVRTDLKIVGVFTTVDFWIGLVKTQYDTFLSNCSYTFWIQKDFRGLVESK